MSPRSYVRDIYLSIHGIMHLPHPLSETNLWLDRSLFMLMLCSFCSWPNHWAKLTSFSSNIREKKSWHTLTLICPESDPPLASQSVCSPFVLCLRRADGQVLILQDIPIGHSRCSLQLVWSVCLPQKGVLYLDYLVLKVAGTELIGQKLPGTARRQ